MKLIQDFRKSSANTFNLNKEGFVPQPIMSVTLKKSLKLCCCQLLQHRSAYKQSHAHHPFGWLAIKLNRVVHWTPVTGDQSA